MVVPHCEKGSAAAAPRTVAQRSELTERFLRCISARDDAADPAADEAAQLASFARRNPSLFADAAAAAGIPIAGRMSVDDAMRLKQRFTWSELRWLRSFLQSLGHDILPSEAAMRAGLAELEYDMAPGTVEYNGVMVPFSQIDPDFLWFVLERWLSNQHTKGNLGWWLPCQHPDAIYLMPGIDRGGGSLKLLLTLLNHAHPQNSRAILPLAYVEGDSMACRAAASSV